MENIVIDVDIINTRETISHISIYNIITEAILYGYYLLYINKLYKKTYIKENVIIDFLDIIHLKYAHETFYLNYISKNNNSGINEIKKTIVIHASKEKIEELASLFRLDVAVYKKTLETFKINLKINHKKFLLGWKTKFLTDLSDEIDITFDKIKEIIQGLEKDNLYNGFTNIT